MGECWCKSVGEIKHVVDKDRDGEMFMEGPKSPPYMRTLESRRDRFLQSAYASSYYPCCETL